jgi:precorrin-6B methylase 2
VDTPESAALPGDGTERDYSTKLRQFHAFAQAELNALSVRPRSRVLDVGCGTGTRAPLWSTR